MSATVTLCERNGAFPGTITENVKDINWKAVDDNTTLFSNYTAVLGLGTNSYVKYNYLKFSGSFTSLGNVRIIHTEGIPGYGIRLRTSDSITLDNDKQQYATPTREFNNAITPRDLTELGLAVNLLVGPRLSNNDPAFSPNKVNVNNSSNGILYTNYFVSQLTVANKAATGVTPKLVLQIAYDEV